VAGGGNLWEEEFIQKVRVSGIYGASGKPFKRVAQEQLLASFGWLKRKKRLNGG